MQEAVNRGIFRQRRPSTAFPNMLANLGTAQEIASVMAFLAHNFR